MFPSMAKLPMTDLDRAYFRIGCYLAVRNLILAGLDTASRSKISFVHSSAESGVFGESGGAFAGFLGILNDDSLTGMNCIKIGLPEKLGANSIG